MAWLPAAVQVVGAVLGAGAAYGSYTMARYQGRVMEQVANMNATNLEIQAGQERAAAQLQAQRDALRNKMQLGDTKATLAGSGFTLNDPTSATIIGQTVEQQTLAEMLVLKQAEQRALGMEAQARQTRFEGKTGRIGQNLQAKAQLMKDGADWFSNYGSGIVNGIGGGGLTKKPMGGSVTATGMKAG